MPRIAAGIVSGLLFASLPSSAHALQGTLVTPVTFTGPVTGKAVSFSLYLPPGYSGGSVRYPVVYHLHGMGGVHNNSNQLTVVSQSHEDAVAAGLMGPALIVFPDGATDSFWADSLDGTRRIETNVVSEIVPYVDASYRTLATREQRGMEGFSMGGFGAAKFAAKFPHLFSAGMIYDGAIVTWSVLVQYHPQVASSMFGNSESYFNQYSPWHWVTQNAATLQADVPFRQVVGTQVGGNQSFRSHLIANGVTPEYLETGCPHTIDCLFASAGADSWSFLGRSFGTATPTPTATPRATARPTSRPTARPTARPTTRPTATPSPTATPTPTVTPTTPSVQVTFVSIGSEDGWVLESTETSGVGGSSSATWVAASGITIGDSASDQQYKGLLSFDTASLPDGATILSATVRLTRGTAAGTNPFTTHGGASVDIRTGGFGNDTALQISDFEAPASASAVATLSNPTANGSVSQGALGAAGRGAINKTGRTQLRIAFTTGDNDDMGADTIGFYPGDNGTASARPELVVTYR
jgi:endo-1,4-beta-xylanase